MGGNILMLPAQVSERTQSLSQVVSALKGSYCAVTGQITSLALRRACCEQLLLAAATMLAVYVCLLQACMLCRILCSLHKQQGSSCTEVAVLGACSTQASTAKGIPIRPSVMVPTKHVSCVLTSATLQMTLQ